MGANEARREGPAWCVRICRHQRAAAFKAVVGQLFIAATIVLFVEILSALSDSYHASVIEIELRLHRQRVKIYDVNCWHREDCAEQHLDHQSDPVDEIFTATGVKAVDGRTVAGWTGLDSWLRSSSTATTAVPRVPSIVHGVDKLRKYPAPLGGFRVACRPTVAGIVLYKKKLAWLDAHRRPATEACGFEYNRSALIKRKKRKWERETAASDRVGGNYGSMMSLDINFSVLRRADNGSTGYESNGSQVIWVTGQMGHG